MLKLRTILFAGAFAVAAAPAIAVDLPDYGSKNFSPAGDTPSYFANEAAPVSARTADTTARDWSAVDEIAPSRSSEGVRSAYSHRGRHGRYSVAQRSGYQGAGRYPGSVRSGRVTGSAHNAVHGRSASSVRTTTAKHGRVGARHANAAGQYAVN
jgi:hypothetical protein